jgi:hypothetical protein
MSVWSVRRFQLEDSLTRTRFRNKVGSTTTSVPLLKGLEEIHLGQITTRAIASGGLPHTGLLGWVGALSWSSRSRPLSAAGHLLEPHLFAPAQLHRGPMIHFQVYFLRLLPLPLVNFLPVPPAPSGSGPRGCGCWFLTSSVSGFSCTFDDLRFLLHSSLRFRYTQAGFRQ